MCKAQRFLTKVQEFGTKPGLIYTMPGIFCTKPVTFNQSPEARKLANSMFYSYLGPQWAIGARFFRRNRYIDSIYRHLNFHQKIFHLTVPWRNNTDNVIFRIMVGGGITCQRRIIPKRGTGSWPYFRTVRADSTPFPNPRMQEW